MTPPENFAKAAAGYDHVQYAQLMTDPTRYRGEIIPISGELQVVRKQPAPLNAKKEGIDFVYEGFVQGPTKKAPPFWIVFTRLPDDLSVSEKPQGEVKFYGYFLKNCKYTASNNQEVSTPY